MGVFKNEVGRPSNDVKKKRLILKVLLGVLVLCIAFLFTSLLLNDLNKEDNKKEEKEEITTTIPTTTTTTTAKKEDKKILNIYGKTYTNDGVFRTRIELSEEQQEGYSYLGTYECKNKDCKLNEGSTEDFTSVIIKDDDYLVYNYKTKEVNYFNLDEYKGKLGYLEDCYASVDNINDKIYYRFYDEFPDGSPVYLLIDSDFKPIFVSTNYDNSLDYFTYLYNGNIMYIKGNKYYTYDASIKKTIPSKEYKSVELISNDYIVVVDNDQYLKVINYNGDVKAKFTKITDDMIIHNLLSGWYEESGKNGIYVVVQDPSVKFEDLSSELQKEIESPNAFDYAYEYYYIPSTDEVGKVATYVGGYAKPVLYLYPKKNNTKIKVSFARPELLTTTYPKFKNSWEVVANKNGDLYDNNNKYYYGLYWEENGSINVDFKTGFYVEKENAIKFLEEKLSYIGLSDKERNEFIMYWLPILEKNKKSLVYFELTESRESYNKLIISPKPDSLLRVAIHVKKVDNKVNIEKQKLTKFKRKGFTAVEWGGVIH